RNFLKQISIGTGALAWGLNGCTAEKKEENPSLNQPEQRQIFNMSGFAAPGIETVRIGMIGVGSRGTGAVLRILQIENVEIRAISDKREEQVKISQENLKKRGMPDADGYYGSENEWKKLCERDDVDLVYICTPWAWHTPMAVYAMEQGKHVAVEVPAAKTLEEAWQLVETSERTRKHCMMLENCCYDFFELLTLNMARQGFFGEIVHVEGAYIHTLLDALFAKDAYADMWRLEENRKDANIYPTHGLGPVCQVLNINRGDKMEYLTSMSSNDFQLAQKAKELAEQDNFYAKYAGMNYRGNMNTSIIRTHLGKTIMVQHDITSPRPYTRIHLLSGTKASARKWPEPARISVGHEWLEEEEMRKLEEQYTPEIVKHIGVIAKEVGGHGGMDFIMDWRLIDCLRNGLPLDQDVYDAALWSSVTPLSEQSVANRSNSVDVPDFTRGSWKSNKPVELTLKGGGTTRARQLQTSAAL
ncbi:MAG: Gfo/Idh/MocA family oxidoreductase, partial [Cyclobacteriaceae bacterium]|nr:Gfo/Idh/MocA family oxidoreductase [Cyclobacteriaceae bacterium]